MTTEGFLYSRNVGHSTGKHCPGLMSYTDSGSSHFNNYLKHFALVVRNASPVQTKSFWQLKHIIYRRETRGKQSDVVLRDTLDRIFLCYAQCLATRPFLMLYFPSEGCDWAKGYMTVIIIYWSNMFSRHSSSRHFHCPTLLLRDN